VLCSKLRTDGRTLLSGEETPMSAVPSVPPAILVVEDEGIVALDLESSLSVLGYRIAGLASSYDEALELAAQTGPDLVLVDVRLRGEPDGLAAAAEIRRRWQTPVVFLTAFASHEMVVQARTVGALGYLIKPFRVDELNATIQLALSQQHRERELARKYSWLRTTLDSLSDAVIATDAAGCVCYLNHTAAALTGWTQAEALGRAIEEVYEVRTPEGQGAPVDTCLLRKALAQAEPVAKERSRLRRRGGAEVVVEDSASPVILDGQILGAVMISCDISERIAAEEQQDRQHLRMREQVRCATAALGDTRAELQALSRHLMTAQEEERRWVARELHDDLGQQTALLSLELSRLQALLPPGSKEAQEVMEALRARSSAIATGLRSVSHRLHPAALEDLGLLQALRMLIEEHRRCGDEICFIEPGSEPLPPLVKETKVALYRIAQEALRNARKHAPQAPVRLTLGTALSACPDELYLSIEDAGPGFDLRRVRTSGGLGLLSIQERARAIGGRLEIDSAPGDGTRIEVLVPLLPAAPRALPTKGKTNHDLW
jgi:hypothetical protein